MAFEAKLTRIELDGEWDLEELSDTTKGYIRLYGFAYSLVPGLPAARRAEVDAIYGKFPWRGGYSTVNFFGQLFHKIPRGMRPEIRRIQYASPGYIELAVLLTVTAVVAKIVKNICGSLDSVHQLYRSIQKGAVDHQLSKINLAREELDLQQRQLAFCEDAADRLSQAFGLSDEEEDLLNRNSKSNPVLRLKILLSVYRRARPLAEKQASGQLYVSGEESPDI